MSGYEEIFDQRGDLYNAASDIWDSARKIERQIIIDLLDPGLGDLICDIPAGGGYLAKGLVENGFRPSQVICVEPSVGFVGGIPNVFPRIQCPLDSVALMDGSMDRVGSLAGLHHLEDKKPFFKEASRLLVAGGGLAVADVRTHTPVAEFLNDSVDKYTETGHKGLFFRDQEFHDLMSEAGFRDVVEEYHAFSWTFPDLETLVLYCKSLFGMVKADVEQVAAELEKYFAVSEGPEGATLPWGLLYARGIKR